MGLIWINITEHLGCVGCLCVWQLFRQHLPAGLGLSIFHNSSLSRLRLSRLPFFLICSVVLSISAPFLCGESEMKFNILFVPLPPIIPSFLLQRLHCLPDSPAGEVSLSTALEAFLSALNYRRCNFMLICLFHPLDSESCEGRNRTFYVCILQSHNCACPTGGAHKLMNIYESRVKGFRMSYLPALY